MGSRLPWLREDIHSLNLTMIPPHRKGNISLTGLAVLGQENLLLDYRKMRQNGRKENKHCCEFFIKLNAFHIESHPLFWHMSVLFFPSSILSTPSSFPPQGLCTCSFLCLEHFSPFPYPTLSLPLCLHLIFPSTGLSWTCHQKTSFLFSS